VQRLVKTSKIQTFVCSLYSEISAKNTSLFTLLDSSRPAFLISLLKVDQDMGMVDQDKGNGRLEWSTAEFIAFFYTL
jgi:hypothetical protein